MFVGHYAAALAAKAAQPKAPLWTYVLGAQLVDVAWGGLVLAGVERMSLDERLPGSPLVLSHMPYTHSLPAAVVWAVAAGLVARFLLKLPRAAAVAVALVVASHWGLDFLVHRPDLPLWVGGPKVGLGWWNHPVPEQALEMGLLAIAATAWAGDAACKAIAAGARRCSWPSCWSCNWSASWPRRTGRGRWWSRHCAPTCWPPCSPG